jgi:hypothetical protein
MLRSLALPRRLAIRISPLCQRNQTGFGAGVPDLPTVVSQTTSSSSSCWRSAARPPPHPHPPLAPNAVAVPG